MEGNVGGNIGECNIDRDIADQVGAESENAREDIVGDLYDERSRYK